MPDETLPVEEFLEREAGGRHHRAVVLADLKSTAEAAHEDLRYDADTPGDVISALELLKDYDFRV